MFSTMHSGKKTKQKKWYGLKATYIDDTLLGSIVLCLKLPDNMGYTMNICKQGTHKNVDIVQGKSGWIHRKLQEHEIRQLKLSHLKNCIEWDKVYIILHSEPKSHAQILVQCKMPYIQLCATVLFFSRWWKTIIKRWCYSNTHSWTIILKCSSLS